MINKKSVLILSSVVLLIIGIFFLRYNNSNNSQKIFIDNDEICDLKTNDLKKCDGKIIRMTESDTDKYDYMKMMQHPVGIEIPEKFYESFFTSEYGYFRLESKNKIDCDETLTITGELSLGEPCQSNIAKVCDPLPKIIVKKFECN